MHPTKKWVVGALFAAGLATATAACSSDEPSADVAPDQQLAPGAEAYATSCATCHGTDGSGGQGPAIGRGLAADKYDRDAMISLVTDGKGAMVGFEGRLSASEIAQIVDYVSTDLGNEDTTTTRPDDGDGSRGALDGVPPELTVGDDWAIANGDYASTRHATGSTINSDNVDDLELVWTYEAPGGGMFGNLTTTPLVVGDAVYLGDLTTRVHAIDRDSGEGRFVAGDDAAIFGPTGVGVGWGRLFGTKGNEAGSGTVLVAYDAESGEELWATDIGGNGGDINMQPSAYGGLVFASTSGYGSGTRATIYALDAETGSIVWDFVVIEDPDLWGNPDINSGGGVWYPPTIDEDLGIAYFGTGNPYPFPGAPGFPNGSSRPGDNRWTDSILALDIETGELVWGYQAIAHDIFDRDAMLTGRVEVEVDGEPRKLAISTGKLGVVFGLDAETGEQL